MCAGQARASSTLTSSNTANLFLQAFRKLVREREIFRFQRRSYFVRAERNCLLHGKHVESTPRNGGAPSLHSSAGQLRQRPPNGNAARIGEASGELEDIIIDV